MSNNNIDLYKKDKAIKRYNFIKELDYTDSEYKKNLRKHMIYLELVLIVIREKHFIAIKQMKY